MSEHTVIALVQARMGSTRLPCKSLLNLRGLPIIDWVTQRATRSSLLDGLIVATSVNIENDPLVEHLQRQRVTVFRGPEDDVLERLRLAAHSAKATHVVRICADNPFIWGEEIDNLVKHYFSFSCDYAYNHIPRKNKYPDGLGAEIISFRLLEKIASEATLPQHREHCLSYIWDNSDSFSISTFDPPDKRLWHPEIKLDIDTLEDYCKLALLPVNIDTEPSKIVEFF